MRFQRQMSFYFRVITIFIYKYNLQKKKKNDFFRDFKVMTHSYYLRFLDNNTYQHYRDFSSF